MNLKKKVFTQFQVNDCPGVTGEINSDKLGFDLDKQRISVN